MSETGNETRRRLLPRLMLAGVLLAISGRQPCERSTRCMKVVPSCTPEPMLLSAHRR